MELCPGKQKTEWWGGIMSQDPGKHAISWVEARDNPYQYRGPRPLLKCEECGRRIRASAKFCHDGCCVYFVLPPHKPKNWWKRGKKSTGKNRQFRAQNASMGKSFH